MQTPIDMKAGIALLGKMDIIEFAVQAAMIGDNGPLTSSPNQRRNMALILADVAASFSVLAARIDPLAESAADPDPAAPRLFVLPAGAFEASLERVGTPAYLAESNG